MGTVVTYAGPRVRIWMTVCLGFGWPALKIRSGSSALSRLMRLLNWCISLSKKRNDEVKKLLNALNWLQLLFA